jgi:hypothetical protein
MNKPNPNLFIEFISLSGEVLYKTLNLVDLRHIYYSWTYIFRVKVIHNYNYSDLEEPGNYSSDTKFVFNGISFTNFSILIYHILTESTIGAINIVTVIKSSEDIYESKYLYENDYLNIGICAYLKRL